MGSTLKDVLEILSSTPAKIRGEVRSLSPRQLKARPARNKWSIRGILAHLDDVEELGMRARVQAMIEQDAPVLEPFDQEKRAVELRYDRKDPLKCLAHFTSQRRANLKWLRTLEPTHLKRKGRHRTVGKITASEMIYEWAFHDLGHIKQILEVKRYALWPHMGNMREFYRLQ